MKKVIGVFVAAVLLSLLGWGIYARLAEKKETPGGPARMGRSAAIAVETSPIVTATVRDVSAFTGTLAPKTSFTVMPKISAKISKIYFNMADHLTVGAVVAELDNTEFVLEARQAEAALAAAQAAVQEANASLISAQDEFARTKTLTEQKIISASDFDAASARVKVQEARLESARSQIALKTAALESANVRLSYAVVTAAWDNASPSESMSVAERFVDEGALIRANEPIISLVNLKTLSAAINVDERSYARLTNGMPIKISADALPGRIFTGKIARISPVLRQSSRQAKVEIDIENPDEILKPGMFIRAEVEHSRHENATVVPAASLAKRDGKTGVFIVTAKPDGKKPGAPPSYAAKFVPVKVGFAEGDTVEIIEPALSGTVVTLGQHLLEDGAGVILPDEGGAGKESSDKSGPGGQRGQK